MPCCHAASEAAGDSYVTCCGRAGPACRHAPTKYSGAAQ